MAHVACTGQLIFAGLIVPGFALEEHLTKERCLHRPVRLGTLAHITWTRWVGRRPIFRGKAEHAQSAVQPQGTRHRNRARHGIDARIGAGAPGAIKKTPTPRKAL